MPACSAALADRTVVQHERLCLARTEHAERQIRGVDARNASDGTRRSPDAAADGAVAITQPLQQAGDPAGQDPDDEEPNRKERRMS